MRFCFVHPLAYPPFKGGDEYASFHLAREISRRGHRVTVITTSPLASHLSSEDLHGVNYVRVPSINYTLRITIPLGIHFRRVMREIAASDIVYVKALMSSFSTCLGIVCVLLRKKMIVQVHANDKGEDRGLVRRLAFGFLGFFALLVLRKSALIQGETAADIESYRRSIPIENKAFLIPPGISTDFFEEKSHATEGRSLLKASSETKIVLFFGRIDVLKGVGVALEAFALLPYGAGTSDAILVIAGASSPALNALRKRANELGIARRVRFVVDADEGKKVWLYDAADLVILPSLFDSVEAFCITLSEAWARRKPVIASNVGALRLRMRNRIDGVLVNPRSPDDLAIAMASLLNDANGRVNLSKGITEKLYTWQETAEQMIGHAQRVIMGRSE